MKQYNKIWSSVYKLIIKETSPKFVTIAVLVLTGINKIAGFGLKAIIAHFLGASRSYDIFIAANTIPEFLSNILFIGLTYAAFIPVFMLCFRKEKLNDFWKTASNLLNIGAIIYILISFILILSAQWFISFIVRDIAPSVEPFTEDEISRTVLLTRVLLVPQLILGLSVVISSILQTFQKFIITQFAPLLFNIGNIIGVFLVFTFNGQDEIGLVIGILIGSLLHLLIQLPQLVHIKAKYKLILNLKDEYLNSFFKLGGFKMLGVVLDQAYILLGRLFAITLVEGSLSAFYFALSIASIPVSVFGTTFATIVFPKLNLEFLNNNIAKFRSHFISTLDKMLILTVPVICILLVLRLPIVRLTLGLGANTSFVWEDTLITAWTLFFLTIGILPETLKTLFTRTVYARNNSLTPLLISTLGIILDITGIILFTNYFSNLNDLSLSNFEMNLDYFKSRGSSIAAIGGIALASSLTVSIVTFIYLLYVNRTVFNIFTRILIFPLIKKATSAIIMTIMMYFAYKRWDEVLNTARTIPLFILTLSTIIIGLVSFLWSEFILRDKILINKLPKFLK